MVAPRSLSLGCQRNSCPECQMAIDIDPRTSRTSSNFLRQPFFVPGSTTRSAGVGGLVRPRGPHPEQTAEDAHHGGGAFPRHEPTRRCKEEPIGPRDGWATDWSKDGEFVPQHYDLEPETIG